MRMQLFLKFVFCLLVVTRFNDIQPADLIFLFLFGKIQNENFLG